MGKPSRPAKGRTYPEGQEGLIDPSCDLWKPVEGFPGYLISTDGRLARLVKVRANKNGTRFARVSVRGSQRTIRL